MRKNWAIGLLGTAALATGMIAWNSWASPVASHLASSLGDVWMEPATLVSEASQGAININNVASTNWAGLLQLGTAERSVSATWTIPSWTSSAEPGSSVGEWVGLGGAESSQLIQIGTITNAASNGAPKTQAFWEVLPASAQITADIPAGTTVTATITPVGSDTWQMSLTSPGMKTPWAQKQITLTPSQAAGVATSADWITEQVMGQNGLIPLAPFGNVTISNVSANGVPLSQMPASTLVGNLLMDNWGQLVSAPTYDAGNPNAFTVEGPTVQSVPVGYENSGSNYPYAYSGGNGEGPASANGSGGFPYGRHHRRFGYGR